MEEMMRGLMSLNGVWGKSVGSVPILSEETSTTVIDVPLGAPTTASLVPTVSGEPSMPTANTNVKAAKQELPRTNTSVPLSSRVQTSGSF